MMVPNALGKIDELLLRKPLPARSFVDASELAEEIRNTYSNQNLKHTSLVSFIENNDNFLIGVPSKIPPVQINSINNKTLEEYRNSLSNVHSGVARKINNPDQTINIFSELYTLFDENKALSIPTGQQLEENDLQHIIGSLSGKNITLDVKEMNPQFSASRPQAVMNTEEGYLMCRIPGRVDFKDQPVTLRYGSHGWQGGVEGYENIKKASRQEYAPIAYAAGRLLQTASIASAIALPFFMDWQLSTGIATTGALSGEIIAQRAQNSLANSQTYRKIGEETLHEKFCDPLLMAPISQEYAAALMNRS